MGFETWEGRNLVGFSTITTNKASQQYAQSLGGWAGWELGIKAQPYQWGVYVYPTMNITPATSQTVETAIHNLNQAENILEVQPTFSQTFTPQQQIDEENTVSPANFSNANVQSAITTLSQYVVPTVSTLNNTQNQNNTMTSTTTVQTTTGSINHSELIGEDDNLFYNLLNAGSGLVNSVLGAPTAIVNSVIGSPLTSLAGSVSNALGSITESVSNTLTSIPSSIGAGVGSGLANLGAGVGLSTSSALSGIGLGIGSALASSLSGLGTGVGSGVSGISTGLNSLILPVVVLGGAYLLIKNL